MTFLPAIGPDVCIRGGGIIGCTLALLLAQARLRVALVSAPRSNHASQDVRAYALNPAAHQLLESLRVWPDAQYATPVREMVIEGDAGGLVRFDAAREQTSALAWIADVPALEQRLAQALHFQPLIDVIEAPAPSTIAAPLTVICEGKASATRAALGVRYAVTRYPHHAIAARLRAERPHGGVARQWFDEHGEILALLPLGGVDAHDVALVWSVAAAHAPQRVALDAEAFAAAVCTASHEALGTLTLTSERTVWPLQRAMAERWTGCMPGSRDAWVLAGDAAHTMHPLAGQGLNAGLADVQALARILREREDWRSVGDPRLLRSYERERRAGVLAMNLATDGLQQLFGRNDAALPYLRNWGMRGFNRTRWLKSWMARQAMGVH
ncbi:MAG: FAD-dependent monooxygenase [Burkholderiaceae bacterium]|jgi:ubiquinone biosynthesis UbiH/UbiF/VisC/COQ6 family hydroxylase|nr:FAD-dependent monooxygenase [Burkholderiaceae bacterium]